MSAHNPPASLTQLIVWAPAPETLHTIDHAAQFSGLPRRHIMLYVRHGLITTANGLGEGGWYFTAETLNLLRGIESMRVMHRLNISGVRFVLSLIKEIERLRSEMDYPYDY